MYAPCWERSNNVLSWSVFDMCTWHSMFKCIYIYKYYACVFSARKDNTVLLHTSAFGKFTMHSMSPCSSPCTFRSMYACAWLRKKQLPCVHRLLASVLQHYVWMHVYVLEYTDVSAVLKRKQQCSSCKHFWYECTCSNLCVHVLCWERNSCTLCDIFGMHIVEVVCLWVDIPIYSYLCHVEKATTVLCIGALLACML